MVSPKENVNKSILRTLESTYSKDIVAIGEFCGCTFEGGHGVLVSIIMHTIIVIEVFEILEVAAKVALEHE